MSGVASTESVDLYPSRRLDVPEIVERKDPVIYGSEADGPLELMHLRQYANRGYLHFEGFFSEDDVLPVIAEVERLRGSREIQNQPFTITEPGSDDVRSIFEVHERSDLLRTFCRHPRLAAIARQLLGGDVYFHQTRVNYKPGFVGKEFYWHSDFETWHVEDGMPRMRAVSCSISLTVNDQFNGPLMLVPTSHKEFVACVGATPEKHFEQSLKKQEYGVPDQDSLSRMIRESGIEAATGPAGSVTFFECNVMHGSNSNITPRPRSNVFVVFNSIENTLVEPFGDIAPRPQFIANRSPGGAI